MALKRVWPWLLLWAVFTGACASSDAARREERPLPPVLFQSPLSVLLEHHQELRLSTDQMIGVGKLDSAMQEKNRPLLVRLHELRPVLGPDRTAPAPSGPPELEPPPGVNPRGYGPSRRRTTWSGPRPPEVPPESEEARQQRLQQTQAVLNALEANASAAYAEAEKLLDEPQRARGRELVAPLREEQRKLRESVVENPPPAAPADAG